MSNNRSLSRCFALLAVALIAMLGAARPAMAQSNCCFANGSPGCDNGPCQSLICGQDPFCCQTEWDGLCADAANQQCAVCQQCQPACGKINVECLTGQQYANRTVVGRFSVGCTAWLIAEPNIVISNAHCAIGNPAGWSVQFNFECDACTNGTPKPTQTFGVQSVLLVDNTNDILIMRLNGNPAGTFGVATLDPTPATVGLPIYEIHHAAGEPKGFDDGVITALNLNVNCPGNIPEHSVSVIASQGASGSPVFRQDNHAVTAICNCGPPCSEGFVLPMSTIFPAIQANANANGYTLQVVGQAACGDPGTGSCCEDNGTPFCDDGACCELICADDPFCCDSEWDQICADQAIDQCEQCFECGSTGAGDCCEANGTPYCDDPACCTAICADDPFCCATNWDSLCVEQAFESPDCPQCVLVTGACCLPNFTCEELTEAACADAGGAYQGDGTDCAAITCPSDCGDPASGDCCEANGTPFCDNAACCETVCAQDPFCCETEWDSLCAGDAAELCGDLCGTPCVGDITGDGVVDTSDLGVLLGDFGCTGAGCVGDITGDGIVDTSDLGILLGDFGCSN